MQGKTVGQASGLCKSTTPRMMEGSEPLWTQRDKELGQLDMSVVRTINSETNFLLINCDMLLKHVVGTVQDGRALHLLSMRNITRTSLRFTRSQQHYASVLCTALQSFGVTTLVVTLALTALREIRRRLIEFPEKKVARY